MELDITAADVQKYFTAETVKKLYELVSYDPHQAADLLEDKFLNIYSPQSMREKLSNCTPAEAECLACMTLYLPSYARYGGAVLLSQLRIIYPTWDMIEHIYHAPKLQDSLWAIPFIRKVDIDMIRDGSLDSYIMEEVEKIKVKFAGNIHCQRIAWK